MGKTRRGRKRVAIAGGAIKRLHGGFVIVVSTRVLPNSNNKEPRVKAQTMLMEENLRIWRQSDLGPSFRIFRHQNDQQRDRLPINVHSTANMPTPLKILVPVKRVIDYAVSSKSSLNEFIASY